VFAARDKKVVQRQTKDSSFVHCTIPIERSFINHQHQLQAERQQR